VRPAALQGDGMAPPPATPPPPGAPPAYTQGG
jgi:hypothetical protein